MIVPNAEADEAFTLRFDPATGLMTELTTLRYQESVSGKRKHWENHQGDCSK
jgi:predicted DNA-binding protein with PD1-like motif